MAKSKEIGSAPNQYRDCIDIAVKIVLGLSSFNDSISTEKLIELVAIQRLSNISIMNDHLPDPIIDLPLRIHQASDILILSRFDAVTKKLKNQLQSLATYDDKARNSNQYQEMRKIQVHALEGVNDSTAEEYSKAILSLEACYNNSAKLFTKYVTESLIGSISTEETANITGDTKVIEDVL